MSWLTAVIYGPTLPGTLFMQLVVLRVSGVIDWPWWYLLAPLAVLPALDLASRIAWALDRGPSGWGSSGQPTGAQQLASSERLRLHWHY